MRDVPVLLDWADFVPCGTLDQSARGEPARRPRFRFSLAMHVIPYELYVYSLPAPTTTLHRDIRVLKIAHNVPARCDLSQYARRLINAHANHISACRLNDVSLEHFTESMERPSLLEFNISNCDQRDERRRKTFPEAAKRKARINNHVRIGQSSEFIDILIVNLSSFVTQATGRWDTKCNGPRNAVQNAFTKNLLRYIAGIGASRRDNANWAEGRFHYETARLWRDAS